MVYTLVIFNQQTLINTIPNTFQQPLSCKLRCVYSHEGKTKVFKLTNKSIQFSSKFSEIGEVLCITCFLPQGKILEIKVLKNENLQLLTPTIQYLSLIIN